MAPIALYPDPLLAQTLAASTYPLEIVELQQWLKKNQGLKEQALADAVAKQPWDASVQSLAGMPEVVNRLANDVQWTTDLGNAFLAQEKDVMDAVQRMRSKAKAKGTLKSGEQQTVKTETVESQQVIVIEQAKPDVVYVPSYDPVVVYGAPVYPYPPVYYPPYYPGQMALTFGVGMAMGAWMSGGWGYGCGWGNSAVVVNNNNRFVRNEVNRSGNRGTSNGNRWQHRPEHRGGTPYRDRATADRYGGTARGETGAQRQVAARDQLNRQSNRVAERSAGAGGDRTAGAGAGGAGNRTGGVGAGDRGGARSGGDRADRIGNQQIQSRSDSGSRNAFAGKSQGFDGSRANSASRRGASSMSGRGARGGGGRRGGGRR